MQPKRTMWCFQQPDWSQKWILTALTEIISTNVPMKYAKSKESILRIEHVVAQLVETLHYKPKDRRFDSRCCH
jgi:hypothetical protein